MANRPGDEEDGLARRFVRCAEELLDRTFTASGIASDAVHVGKASYIANAPPRHPPRNRDPGADEIIVSTPYVRRHIELVDHDIINLIGDIACQVVLKKNGVLWLWGQWVQGFSCSAFPVTHDVHLFLNAVAQRDARGDGQSLSARLESLSV